MKIGVFTQGYVRKDTTPQERVQQVVAEAIATEEAGLHSFGVSEQHFRYPTNSTGPIDAIMAAIAQATSTIKISPGAVILPLHHPINVAERWAAIDIISGGRVRFGVGKGNNPKTFDAFGVHSPDSHEITVDALKLILKAWTQETFEHSSRWWNVPEVGLCPRPIQEPHPPIAWSGLTVETAATAAEMQLQLMGGAVANDWDTLETVVATYRDQWDKGSPLPLANPSNYVSILLNGHIGHSFQQVKDEVEYGLVPYINRVVLMKRELLERSGKPDPTYGEEYLDNFDKAIGFTPSLFGTPDEVYPTLERLQSLGIDEINVTLDYARHDEMLRTISLLGELSRELSKNSATQDATA